MFFNNHAWILHFREISVLHWGQCLIQVWGEGIPFLLPFSKKKKNLKNLKNSKKMFTCFSFSTVTVYRLYHTHSLGSVEPTIALSESLWSRIVTLINKKIRKSKISKKSVSVMCLFVLCAMFFSIPRMIWVYFVVIRRMLFIC